MPGDETMSMATGPVHRAFHVLQIVVAAEGPIGTREIARRSGLPKSTAGRLVGLLADLGMVERGADGAVSPGSALTTLRPSTEAEVTLGDRCRPLLVELVDRFGENAAVGIDTPDGFRYDMVRTTAGALRVPNPSGRTFPFHCVAPGLVAMAFWDTGRLDAHLAEPLAPATERSVTDPAAIRTRLTQIRADGFAWADQELDLEVNGIAVPILDGGRAVAVVSLYGPAHRLAPDVCAGLAEELRSLVDERTSALLPSVSAEVTTVDA